MEENSVVAEGEELGSNLLQVLHRRPTELGGLGWVAGALPAPSLRIEGRETAILPRRQPLAAKIRAGCATTSKLWPLPRSADRRPLGGVDTYRIHKTIAARVTTAR